MHTSRNGPARGWYIVGLLSVAMAFSLVDRFALSLLFQPIKLDLGVSDTQLGLLHGIAFGLFYAFMGVPLGYAVDRISRKWIVWWGIVLWSTATALCGTAVNYAQLLAARVGVGVGEAALSPAGYSMIADSVPRQHLGKAISVFQMGSVMGGGLALAVGGKLYSAAQHWDLSGWPLLAQLAPWRITFILLAAPGILLAILIAAMREPTRTLVAERKDSGVLRFMSTNKTLWVWFFICNACLVSISYANITWAPTLLIRQYGWTTGEAGWRMGLAMMVVAPVGVLIGGWLADRWHVRDGAAGFVRVLQMSPLLALPFVLGEQLSSSATVVLGMIIVVQFIISLVVGVGPALVQILVPAELRGRVSALYVLVVNLIGLGIGPVVVGSLSDRVFAGTNAAIANSVETYSVAMLLAALVSVTLFRRRLVRAEHRAERAAAR